jgi:hypothetical protein
MLGTSKASFLFPLENPSDRFTVNESGDFEYHDHQTFETYTTAISMRFKGVRLYFPPGTLGAGKSHLQGALSCLLVKKG